MKSVLTNPKEKYEIPFPKLMRGNGTGSIVLFTRKGVGTVVYNGGLHSLGEHGTDWRASEFTDYDGSVILSN